MFNSAAAVNWESLPKPQDDGRATHLVGQRLPAITLLSTSTSQPTVDLQSLEGLVVIYAYPRTGVPDEALPPGWDNIPGARGCTPQTQSFSEKLKELKTLGVSTLYGLSTQDTQFQRELSERLNVPFDILSDSHFKLTDALNLPTFETNGLKLLKRLTMAVKDGVIIKIWYPIFPPTENANQVTKWLLEREGL